jgi:hypothetical protein
MLGSSVGGIIVLTNSRTLVQEAGLAGPAAAAIYVAIVALWAAAVAWSVRTVLQERGAGRGPGLPVPAAAPRHEVAGAGDAALVS